MPRSHPRNGRQYLWSALVAIGVSFPLVGCGQPLGASRDAQGAAAPGPAAGTELSRVTLTAKAAERLDVKTAPVREEQVTRAGNTSMRKIVPYAAVLYDSTSRASVYTNPEPLVFVRRPISIDYIEGDRAVLSDGPAAGTAVVVVGAAELFGAEFEVGR